MLGMPHGARQQSILKLPQELCENLLLNKLGEQSLRQFEVLQPRNKQVKCCLHIHLHWSGSEITQR